MELTKIAELRFYCDDLNKELSVKDYLKELLLTLWRERESFSGKRPFGNSGWDYDVYKPLIENNVVKGTLDDDGYIDEVDTAHANTIIAKIIVNL